MMREGLFRPAIGFTFPKPQTLCFRTFYLVGTWATTFFKLRFCFLQPVQSCTWQIRWRKKKKQNITRTEMRVDGS